MRALFGLKEGNIGDKHFVNYVKICLCPSSTWLRHFLIDFKRAERPIARQEKIVGTSGKRYEIWERICED